MPKGFWAQLDKPILVLAPMAGVTDTAFRQIVAKCGKPDVLFTEFVSCDGLCSAGKVKLLKDLWYSDQERPIVGQVFGSKPENFYQTARLLADLKFDGIDINTGCPDKSVEKQGAGAALIKNPTLIKKILMETRRGAGNLPVSIKTRLGYNENSIGDWIKHLLELEPAAVTIHARTRREMSNVPAQWDALENVMKIRNKMCSKTLIIGNGDIKSISEAHLIASQTGVDGVMIGRGIYGNPWLFSKDENIDKLSWKTRLNIISEHAYLFDAIFQGEKNFALMRKFFNSYVTGFPFAKSLKIELMGTNTPQEVDEIICAYLKQDLGCK